MTQGGQGGLPRLGNYQLMRPIGRGGFADVYLARHVHLKSYVAIKVLKMDFPTQELIDEFLGEAQTIADLEHVNIVRVHDFDVVDDIAFLVMDHAPYGSLRTQYALRTQVPLDAVLSYIRQIASALEYAHQHRVIHCDVKPENMLVAKDYRILLSDFGLATMSALSQSISIQQPGEVAGTVAYIAPEQLQGKPRPASDQYALAITAYEWLCGRRPFIGTVTQVMSQHMHAEPAPLHMYNSDISLGVEQVILQALEKDPRQRFRRVLDFSEALDAAAGVRPRRVEEEHFTTQIGGAKPVRNTIVFPSQAGGSRSGRSGSIRASKPSQSGSNRDLASVRTVLQEGGTEEPLEDERPVRHLSRRNLLIASLGAAGAAGSVSVIALLFHGGPPSGQTALSPQKTHPAIADPTAKVRPTATPTKAPQKPSPTATKSPDEPTPTPTQPPAQGTPSKPLGTLYAYYQGHGTVVYATTWSPDGLLVASGGGDSTVQTWKPLTGAQIGKFTGHTGAVTSVAWSPDTTSIASGGADKTVRLWSTTGNLLATCQGHTGAVTSVAWSPDSKRVVSGGTDNTVRLWDTGGNLLVTNGDHTGSVTSVSWSSDSTYVASASADGTVQIWNVTTGAKILYRGHTGAVNAVAVSPDSTHIVSGGTDTTAQVYTASGALQTTYKGHSKVINSVAWTLDGARIASASADVSVQIWDAKSGSTQYKYGGHLSTVHCASWSPDGTLIASGEDVLAQVWQA